MIKIVCVGKIKEKYLNDAINEYKKRLSSYTRLDIIELSDESFQDIEKIKKQEGEKILSKVSIKDFVITLEIEGNQLTSSNFADLMDKTLINNSNLTFIIGGSYGLSQEVINRSNYKLSFSKMTFPHQLFRVLLLEQLYRAYKINNNESYHK